MSDDVYEILRQKINRWPVKAPKSKDMLKLLSIVYTPEEAEFISSAFNTPLIDAKTVEQVAEETGKDIDYVKNVFERLASKGALFEFTSSRDGKTYYSMLPYVAGIFELHMNDGVITDEKREFARIHEKMYNHWGYELGASNYPFMRVIPIEEKIDVQTEILPFEKVSKYIEEARSIAVNPCACRLSENKCDKPIDVCISFGRFADYMVKHRNGRYLTKEEASELLEKIEDAGLVHTINNQQDRPNFICNCCTCCCILLKGLSLLHNPRTFTKSNFMPQIDPEACRLCETCVKWCPLQALFHHHPHTEDLSDDLIMILEERCIGCGICAHKCPNDAITLVRVREEVPEKTGRDALMRVESEKI
ncbi:MAG: 4Fe-4S binding protein, partial [Candidatus Lokiarchaeia archaeon]